MSEIKFKSDKYKKSRGGLSRLLDISCANCGQHICFYQKDGPGILKRMYLDRICDSTKFSSLKSIPQLTCASCKQIIGIPYIYEKEKRLAYRLIIGRISKKVTKTK